MPFRCRQEKVTRSKILTGELYFATYALKHGKLPSVVSRTGFCQRPAFHVEMVAGHDDLSDHLAERRFEIGKVDARQGGLNMQFPRFSI